MGIKNRIKLSFFIIIVLILTIGTLSITILYQIKTNNSVKDKISQIILIQERMNESIEEQIKIKDIKSINNMKIEFNEYEKSFESIKKQISLNQKSSPLSTLFRDKQELQKINSKLKLLFENEHKIELAFERMHTLQESYIKLNTKFQKLYPKENSLRKELEKYIASSFTSLTHYHTVGIFGQIQYYSKETLYQYQNQATLNKWLYYTEQLNQNISNELTKDYLKIVKETGAIAIKIKKTTLQQEKLLKDISAVLKENKQTGMNISQTIENISSVTTNKAFIILFSLTAGILIFLGIFSYVVVKRVGLSIDEIETKVEEGLIEITNLNDEISDTQKEVIFTMGAIGEQRSKETGNHVKRVAEYSKILALHYGLSTEKADMLKQASPMHDIGKVAIPDSILNKPGKFEPHERKIMETHANLGFEMLKSSNRPLLKMAAIVAGEHHEKWDGSGYPKGLKKEEIHIYGRITALADVFDALGSDRVYKKAWENDRIFTLFKKERGKHFEPKLIDIFFEHLDEFLAVQRTFKDI